MSINPKNIRFDVINNKNFIDYKHVLLSIGPVSIDVCDKPKDFPEFLDLLIEQLTDIKKELEEYYEENDY